jgi:hypothetical protein
VYANLTIELYRTFESPFFRIYGATYAVITLVLWVGVAARTLVLVRSKQIFEAPCLEDIDMGKYDARPTANDGRNSKKEIAG